MIRLALACAAGALFGVGLTISGMTQPAKVVGFLDFFGSWDPSLVFVMGGAVTTYYFMHTLIIRRGEPAFAPRFHLPTKRALDGPLILGAILFGTGWGLAGFCPGPAITAAGAGARQALIFTAALAAGMLLFRLFQGFSNTTKQPVLDDNEENTPASSTPSAVDASTPPEHSATPSS